MTRPGFTRVRVDARLVQGDIDVHQGKQVGDLGVCRGFSHISSTSFKWRRKTDEYYLDMR